MIVSTQSALSQNELKPNSGVIRNDKGENMQNHILKLICGAGKHCKNAVLKNLILRVVKDEMGFEAYMNEEKGNVLVRI